MSENVMTHKQIAKRIKSKGLGKVKFYCQMCEKQCRDASGYKSHCLSETHRRNMELFLQRKNYYIEKFSKEFERDFLDVLRTRFGSQEISANKVYNEYIRDKDHTRMNSTRWVTLSNFIKSMNKKGVLEILRHDGKNFIIKYKKRDEKEIKRIEKLKNRRDDVEFKRIMKQLEAAKKMEEEMKKEEVKEEEVKEEEVKEEEMNEKISFSLNLEKPEITKIEEPILPKKEEEKKEEEPKMEKKEEQIIEKKRKLSEIDLILLEEEKRREKRNRKDYWLHKNIIVKVLHKKLENGAYYSKKGKVIKVIDKYIGEILMLDSGDIIRIDQSYLETVIPKIGGKVLIVNGSYRGEKCILESVNFDTYSANLKSIFTGRIIKNVKYEDFSKFEE